MIGQRLGRYVVSRALGAGAMGHVYEAIEEPLGRRVAIKVLDATHADNPTLRARFQNEVRASSTVSHPAVVSIYGLDETPAGVVFLVMEVLSGETLRERMRREGSLPWPVVLGIARQLAGALREAHARGVIHRDIKPANIMLTEDPDAPGGVRVKLIDFGIAKLPPMGEAGITDVHTVPGLVMGTPGYIPPEQCRDVMLADGKSDVYAVAATLFHALTGQLAVGAPGASAEALMYAHLHHEPRSLSALCPTLPSVVSALWQRMLAKEPRLRPTMAEVAELLRSLPEHSDGLDLALRPGQTVRSYRVVRRLCHGPRGAFLDAVHSDSDTIHAIIKIPAPSQVTSPPALAELRAEAQALMTQVDPGIIKILDFGQLASGLPYVIMEHLQARSLRSLCDFMAEQRRRHSSARLRAEQLAMVVRTIRQIAGTLAAGPGSSGQTLALRPEGLLVVPNHAHHAEPLVKVLDLGFGETLAGIAPSANAGSTKAAERVHVALLGALTQELLLGGVSERRRRSTAPRALQQLLSRMQDAQPERRPRLAEVMVALDRLQATTLIDRRGGWDRMAAAVFLLFLGAVAILYAQAGVTSRAAQERDRQGRSLEAGGPRGETKPGGQQEQAAQGSAGQLAAVLYGPPAPLPGEVKPSKPTKTSHRPRLPPPPPVWLRLQAFEGGSLQWSADGKTQTTCRAQDCATAALPVGTKIRVVALPDAGWYFQGWPKTSLGCTAEGPCDHTLSAESPGRPALEAHFGRMVALRCAAKGDGEVLIAETGQRCGDAMSYRPGQRLRLTARPRGNARLQLWAQPATCQQRNPCEVTLPPSGELHAEAVFSVPEGKIRVGAAGCGQVEIRTARGRWVTSGGAFTGSAPLGTELMLRVLPPANRDACPFNGWSPGSGCPDAELCRLRVQASHDITASFTGGAAPAHIDTDLKLPIRKDPLRHSR